MGITEEIRQLIKNKVIIRHRFPDERTGIPIKCMICNREIIFKTGALCMVIERDGLLCPVCGEIYAPDMAALLQGQVMAYDMLDQKNSSRDNNTAIQAYRQELIEIKENIEKLIDITDTLSKGIARGIVEAPAGHIGLMHYAKDIHKPERKMDELEKDYDLRVKTYRISRLYEKIYEDTTGRVKKIVEALKKIGLPVGK